jgi:predicted RNase H-like HicB family nuclease
MPHTDSIYRKRFGNRLICGHGTTIPGAHTQADTLDELQENLKEVLELCLEEMEPENTLIHWRGRQEHIA